MHTYSRYRVMESADNLARIKNVWEKKRALRGRRNCSKIRLRQALRTLDQTTREYFYDTGLHGFKYITSSDSTFIEKIIWILICAVGTIFCIILMCLAWKRFEQNPTVTTIQTTSYPIWELPFPAVTICSFNKIYLPRVERFVKEFKNIGLNETEIDNFFKSLPKLIRPDYINVNVTPGMQALATLGYTVEHLMQMLMQPCDKLLVNCAWLGRTYDCSKMFRTVKSIEGFCCSFNYHALTNDLDVEQQNENPDTRPDLITPSATSTKPFDKIPGIREIQMVSGSGRDVGLSVTFDLEGEFHGGGTRPYIGASILIHDPQDYPEISLLTVLVEPGKEVDVSVTGTILESVENIRGLDVEQRQCWFDDERSLNLSSEYSYQTCITECRIDEMKKLCNCVPFYYPNLYIRTCELTDVKCMRDHRRILSSLRGPIDDNDDDDDRYPENRTIEEADCKCSPQCSDKWYSIVTEIADIKGIKYNESISENHSHSSEIRNISTVYIYFRDITCMKYRKDILLTWDGFLASFGGIFGLCLGGSVISLVELIYYYFVKIFHHDEKRRRITHFSINHCLCNDEKLDNRRILNNSYPLGTNKFTFNDPANLSEQLKRFKHETKLKLNYLE